MTYPIKPGKRLPESLQPGEHPAKSQKKTHPETQEKKEGLLKEGPFEGLPLPFQKRGYKNVMPYIGCNEEKQHETLAFLVAHPSSIPPEHKVHLGFSVWFNLDLISQTTPAYAILCDIDEHVMDIYKAISECLAKSQKRSEFVEHFELFLNEIGEEVFGLPATEMKKLFDISGEPERPDSWLATDTRFENVKKLSDRGAILYLNVDIMEDSEKFLQIHDWLKKKDLELDTLYASNIVEWVPNDLKGEAYIRNLRTISSPKTRFIQAYKPEDTGQPIQFCTIGTDSIKLPIKKVPKKIIRRI